jgi:hypothetical protein
VFRLGGAAALVFGICYVIIMVLYVPMGAPPSGAEARLAYTAANSIAWWAILALSVLTDFLLIPIALALFIALQPTNRSLMLLAVTAMGLFVVLDLALTWTNTAVLISLSQLYAAGASETHRAAFVAAAQVPVLMLESTLLFVYNSLTLAVGLLLTGAVMLKGGFGKTTAYLAVFTGILGIIAVAGPLFASALSSAILLASALTTLWFFMLGFKLWRHA